MYGSELEMMVGKGENILWRGRPDKKCFIFESIFNPLMPFALLWLIIDLAVIFMAVGASDVGDSGMGFFLIPFFALHLMPVWIYLGGLFTTIRKYRNTEYIVTDKGIYVSGGWLSKTYEMKPFTDLSHINIHRGIFDQWLGVGDVISQCHHTSTGHSSQHGGHAEGISICDIPDYAKVFQMIRDLQTDIYADTMFPNDMRPEANHGYRTQYKPENTNWDEYPSFKNDGFDSFK